MFEALQALVHQVQLIHQGQRSRATGSAFKPLAGIPRLNLRLKSGGDCLLVYGDEGAAHDLRCR